MNNVQKFDFVPSNLVQECIDYYYSIKTYDTKSMAKANYGDFIYKFLDIVESIVGNKLKPCSGNFYRHKEPYLPHTDYKQHENNFINVVIPLQYEGTLPHLVVFDQTWKYDSVTWCLNYPVIDFKINTGVKGCPYEYPVDNLTGLPIDSNLYTNYLSHLEQDCLHGLSGDVYPFIPKSIIVFDCRKIHCTSTLTNYKLGLSLRYTNLT